MTPEEYRLLDNHDYSLYTGKMGEVFCEWHDKKIDKKRALRDLNELLDEGLGEIKGEKYAEIKEKELKRCFDSLALFIMYTNQLDTKVPTFPNKSSFSMVLLSTLDYPKFKDDYEMLKENEYLLETVHGLRWIKSKQSLAEYFHSIANSDKKMSWKTLEKIFDVKDLKNSLSNNGNEFKKKSKDFEQWEKIKNTPKGK